jgi:light-independent protochlorophyllide reductase subunit B
MQLTIWTYEGPPHVGAMRIAASMRDVHFVLHAPQGDTYADLLFTMIERHDHRPPVSYTTFQARDLGGETAGLAKRAIADAYLRFKPQLMLVGDSCTAELLQDQPGTLATTLGLPVPVVPLELNSYAKKENWGAGETLYQLVRAVLSDRSCAPAPAARRRPTANILGPTALGFRCRDDIVEVDRLLAQLGIEVNAVVPLGASVDDVRRLPDANFNIDLYPEVSGPAAQWLERTFGMPRTRTIPIGLGATREFIAEVAQLAGVDPSPVLGDEHPGVARLSASQSRAPWYARSVDSTYLTGKRVFIFGDATHAVAAARVASETMGFEVVGLGTYSRERAREVREAAARHGVEALVTDDYLEVEAAVEAASPELVLGTQMERHIAKRMGIACAVISTPMHVQDVPARFSPVMGFEGANVLFDSWVQPMMMGLEEHLLQMFRDDFEFHDAAPASHLPATSRPAAPAVAAPAVAAPAVAAEAVAEAVAEAAAPAAAHSVAQTADVAITQDKVPGWTAEGERELRKIPFFVRAKARRNAERFAAERGVSPITVETLYEAKAHFGR